MRSASRSGRSPRLIALLCLSLASPSLSWAQERVAYQSYKKAVRLLEEEKWDAAIGELKQAVGATPRSGSLRFGMFQEKYFPYYQLGRAYLAKGDTAAAERYFSQEEHEGKIQRLDPDLWRQLRRYLEALQQTPGPSPPGPPIPSVVPAALLEEARRSLANAEAFEASQGPSMTAAGRQKLASLKKRLQEALESSDPERLTEATRSGGTGLAELRLALAEPLLQKRRSLMSRDNERELRGLSGRLHQALASGNEALADELGPSLDQATARARELSRQAYDAIRIAFARAGAGRSEEAIRALEAALASQQDNAGLHLLLARFYFDRALDGAEPDEGKLTRAKDLAAQAFRLQPDLSYPERYFPPRFLDLVREVRGAS